MRSCLLLCLFLSPSILFSQAATEEPTDEPEEQLEEGCLTDEEAKSLLQRLDSDFYYDRKAALKRIGEAGLKGALVVAKVWSEAELSSRARTELTEFLIKMDTREASLLLVEMALVETDGPLLQKQIRGVIIYAQRSRDGTALDALKRLVSALTRKKGVEWMEKTLRSAYRQLVITTFEWMREKDMLGGSYPGQFSRIAGYGKFAVEALIDIVKENGVESGNALNALLDIVPDAELYADRIEKLFKEKKFPQSLRVEALLYLMGRKEYLQGRIERLEAKDDVSSTNYAVMNELMKAYRYIKRYDRCEQLLKRIIGAGTSNGTMYYNLACYQAMQNKTEEALESIEKAFENGFSNYEWMKLDKEIENIRNTEKFKELLKKYFGVEEEKEGERDEDMGS